MEDTGLDTSEIDVVVVGGAGHVGLPLGLMLAKVGLRVGILDIAEGTLQRIRRGEMPFLENGADELLRDLLPTGRLELTAGSSILGRTDNVIIVIGTPIDEFLNPSMTIFERTVNQLVPHLRDGALVVLRSTVYPGTTAHVRDLLADRAASVDVAFCPERIAEGHAIEELESLPQIIGADELSRGH